MGTESFFSTDWNIRPSGMSRRCLETAGASLNLLRMVGDYWSSSVAAGRIVNQSGGFRDGISDVRFLPGQAPGGADLF